MTEKYGRWLLLSTWALVALGHVSVLHAEPTTATLKVKAFTLKGPRQKLEPEVLDFRYAPSRWQTCIGLPDDPHKTIVGSDGALYYDYGRGRFYDFATRVRAHLDTEGTAAPPKQHLLDARIPIVITDETIGNLTLRREAWAATPFTPTVSEWSHQRIDYLWLSLKNTGDAPQSGRITVQIDSRDYFQISPDCSRLLLKGNSSKAFCSMSPPCQSVWPPSLAQTKKQSFPPIEVLGPAPGVFYNWARSNTPCDERFRDVLVGYNRPLRFQYPIEQNKTYRIVFGLIEGYHRRAGARPLEIRIEGQVVRSLDLNEQYGQNTPVLLSFTARDRNNDGLLQMGVHSPANAPDKNTILTCLWILPGDSPLDDNAFLSGRADKQALAVLYPKTLGSTARLIFPPVTLPPGRDYRVLLAFPRGERADLTAAIPESRAAVEKSRAVTWWKNADLPFDRFQLPDPAAQNLLDACIRNIYQARELRNGQPAFQVGPTCYRGTWAADGPFILEAVTYLGRAAETRAGLELQVVRDEGPGGVAFSKKTGLRLWMIWRHAQLTGDWTWLNTMWPTVKANVDKIVEYRQMTRSDPCQANYGLMPIGFGDGGLGGSHREYTNVYWTLAGLKAALAMAHRLNKPQLTPWRSEYDDYWAVFDRARRRDRLSDDHNNLYVPVTMKGEKPQSPQRGAWAFLQSIYPGRIFEPDDPLMRGTLAMLDAHQEEGLIHGTGWLPEGVWNYAGSFYAHAHLWLGHGRKSAATFYAFANHASPLLCWREEQNLKGRPENYCGDMPHNWASAEFIRLVRHMLLLERGRELHLFEGLPRAWIKPGARLHLRRVPTSFGEMDLSLRIQPDGGGAVLRLEPRCRESLDRIVVHLEHFDRPIKSVKLGQKDMTAYTCVVPLDKIVELEIQFDTQ